MTLGDISDKFGLTDNERASFAEYAANRFANAVKLGEPDTGFLETWEKTIQYAAIFGADKAINTRVCPNRPVEFNSPETLKIEMYSSIAGKIPVIYVRDTADFEQLVTNVAYKGVRPDNISTTGASFLSGKTTRFIILSAKPYSNVPAAELGLPDEKEWEETSLLLRRGHECTHYFTKQTYGITNNILHDEVMADFMGIFEAFGFYKAEWFLRFMGIIKGSGARFIFYTKDLSENVRSAAAELASQAAYGLEKWSRTDVFRAMSPSERIEYMCMAGLEGMINIE
ncbi:MAG: hypothetical protein J6N15_06080 [Ruminiclostridium sp.]|nr:hypothetical protein [Ruminiclostridium sp.]